MNDIERKLRSTLYRAFCPDSTELGEYHLGLLAGNRRQALSAHLAECPHCTRELAQLRSFMETVRADIEPELRPGERSDESLLRRIVARFLPPDISSMRWSPALAGVRGEAGDMLSFHAEGYHIVIDMQVDAGRPDRRSILGLLTGSAPASTVTTARLYQAESLAAQSQVDEFGNFAIHMISPGEYSLLLSSAEVEIHIEQLTIS